MNENQFYIDLGDIELTPAQRTRINSALQAAVTRELLDIRTVNSPTVFPFQDLERVDIEELFGEQPIFRNGVIIRDFDKQALKGALRNGKV